MRQLPPLLRPYQPSEADPFDRVKAAHLLNRAGFGPTSEDIELVMKLGPAEAVEGFLSFPDQPAEMQTPEDVPDLSAIAEYPRTFREVRALYQNKDEEERRMIRQRLQQAQGEAIRATAHWWLTRMVRGPHPLQEKLALFWHGHFTTSAQDTQSASRIWQQNELLRRQAAGSFRTFLQRISRDPAMLDYLNNQQNRRQSPNENYARELMELFTLGIGNYSEQDVKEAARAFTGWGHDGERFVFRHGQHDDAAKTFLGRHGNFDGDDIIDIILSQPACGPYIAGRLWRYFVHDDPHPSLVRALGQVLVASNYELRPVLRTMLSSRAFYDSRIVGSQIKSPVQLLVGTIRLMDMRMPPQQMMQQALRQMGQVPFYPPNVKGWPGGKDWITSSTLFARYNTMVRLVREGRYDEENPLLHANDGREVLVDRWLGRLVQRPVSADKRQVLIDSLGDGRLNEQSVRRMVQLIVSMPEYQLC